NWTRYHSLLIALGEMGHEVHILQPPPLDSSETNYQEIKSSTQKNIFLHDVPINSALWNFSFPVDKLFKKALFSMLAYRKAKELTIAYGIDILLLYNIPQYFFSNLTGLVQIFDYADDYVDMLGRELGRFNNRMILGVADYVLKTMMKRAAITTTVSYELSKMVEGNVLVLPNGVNRSAFEQVPKLSAGILRNEGKPIVGFLGAFEYFIDFDVVLNAAEMLPDVHFLLVGTGRDWKIVSEKADSKQLKNIQLTGGVPHTQVFSYIQAMDICLNVFKPIPVSHRACPIKLFEYMSQQKPVITTRLDELKNIDSGYLYYADSGSELATAIRSILGDCPTAREKAQIGFQTTIDSYTWEMIAENFVEMLQPAIANLKKETTKEKI
ncbi:MAG: glycosyltransferase, partial [Thermotogota bacterium]|nr:glycosyltransferase [Thermotogota bacterium]